MLKFKKIRKKKNEEPIEFFYRAIKGAYATYNMNNLIQCYEGKHRTYDDLYKIFQYYYPNRPESEFIRTIRQLLLGGFINWVYCGTVDNVTFYPLLKNNLCAQSYNPILFSCGYTLFFNDKKLYEDWGGYKLEVFPKIKPLLEKFNVQYFK